MDARQSDAPQTEAEWPRSEEEAIANGERIPPALGIEVDRDMGVGTYQIDYLIHPDEWPDDYGRAARVPDSEELRYPVPPEAFRTDDRMWDPIWYPLISYAEAQLAKTRFGSAKRKVVRVLFESPNGAVIHGKGLGEAVARAFALATGDDLDLSPGNVRTLFNAAQSLGRWGFIHIFSDIGSTIGGGEGTYLLTHTPLLREAMGGLLNKGWPEFADKVGSDPEPELDPADLKAKIDLWSPESVKEGRRSAIHYADSRTVGTTSAMVHPEEMGYPEQTFHLVTRNRVSMQGMTPSVAAFQLVSKIEAPSSLSQYTSRSGAAIAAVFDEMRGKGRPTNAEDVRAALGFLTTDDQIAVLEFVHQHLTPAAARKLRELQYGGLVGIDLTCAAVQAVTSGKKRRSHVLFQIRLLVGDIVRDLLSWQMGHYHASTVMTSGD